MVKKFSELTQTAGVLLDKYTPVGLEDISGTSFWDGYVKTSAEELTKLFGEHNDGDGEKIERQWFLRTSDGINFTIHDWREGHIGFKRVANYHIGTEDEKTTEKVVKALKEDGLQAYIAKFA